MELLVARGRHSGTDAIRTPVGGSKALYASAGGTVRYTTGLRVGKFRESYLTFCTTNGERAQRAESFLDEHITELSSLG